MLNLKKIAGRRVGGLPQSASRMGVANAIHPDDVLNDPSIGPGIELPAMPDFATMAEEQAEAIASYDTFHEAAIGFFAPKLDEEALRYCHKLHRVYEEYSTHLRTTYRASLSDRLKQAELRLSALPYMHAAIELEDKQTTEGSSHDI